MRLSIQIRGPKMNQNLHNYIEERLRFSLSRFARHVLHVSVYLNETGGRQQTSWECRILVALPRNAHVVVTESAGMPRYALIDRAVERVQYAVKQFVKRRLARTRRRAQPAAEESMLYAQTGGLLPAAEQGRFQPSAEHAAGRRRGRRRSRTATTHRRSRRLDYASHSDSDWMLPAGHEAYDIRVEPTTAPFELEA